MTVTNHRRSAPWWRLPVIVAFLALIAVLTAALLPGHASRNSAGSIPAPMADVPPGYLAAPEVLAACEDRLASQPPSPDPQVAQWLRLCTSAMAQPSGAIPTPEPTTPAPTTVPPATTEPPSSSTSTTRPPPSTTTSPPPAGEVFPGPDDTGVPAGWTPARTQTVTLRISSGVLEDVRLIGANLEITGPRVTVRRVEIQGGRVVLATAACRGVQNSDQTWTVPVLQQVSVVRRSGQTTGSGGTPAIGPGGYIADRVKVDGLPEGLRVGGAGDVGCRGATVLDSFVRAVAPDQCGDWHGDGLQGYDGGPLTIRDSTLILQERGGCGGTAALFYPRNQGNTGPVTIDGLLVGGGYFTFRLGMSGSVTRLRLIEGMFGRDGPIDVRCSVLSSWSASVVRVTADYRIASTARQQSCNTEAGF